MGYRNTNHNYYCDMHWYLLFRPHIFVSPEEACMLWRPSSPCTTRAGRRDSHLSRRLGSGISRFFSALYSIKVSKLSAIWKTYNQHIYNHLLFRAHIFVLPDEACMLSRLDRICTSRADRRHLRFCRRLGSDVPRFLMALVWHIKIGYKKKGTWDTELQIIITIMHILWTYLY